MSATNAQIARAGMATYWAKILNEIEQRCRRYCADLCQEAIRARLTTEGAHNFTGNFINSIVTCLYRERNPIIAYYAAQYVPEAIQVKMKERKRRSYYFKPDYDGENSHYLPKVNTNGGWGVDDARNFFQEFTPQGKNLFDIIVVYPVEYANWIEMKRGTTGIMQTYSHAEQVGVQYLQLVRR